MIVSLKKAFLIYLICILSAISAASFSTNSVAQACSYNEALLAFSQDNTIRGVALMKIAAKDGDKQAINYLAVNYPGTFASMQISIPNPLPVNIKLSRAENPVQQN